MIRIGQIKLKPDHSKADLKEKIAKTLHISEKEILEFHIRKQSIDARKKPQIWYVYTIDVLVTNEKIVMRKQKGNQAVLVQEKEYHFPEEGTMPMEHPPVIIGSGPAGLFCAYFLAMSGYNPIVYERGASVEEREKDIAAFWETGILNTESNVQFGEGGAGTFSDGKLNTLVKDAFGRNKKVLEIFVKHGAPEDILYTNKPHIGTDILIRVVRSMREQIRAWGGSFQFHSQLKDFSTKEGKVETITIHADGVDHVYPAEVVVLAIGHSARDTFQMLYDRSLLMSAKSFAIGVRAEHLQEWIDESQYGAECPYELPAAAYKVATTLENGRGVYSFCMCPGGYVVNASSEPEKLAINGMSYHARNGKNANSAIIVTVSPEDFGEDHPLAGITFQRALEKNAYKLGNGKIPVQRFEDFCQEKETTEFGVVEPQMKGSYHMTNIRSLFPKEIAMCIQLGMQVFGRQIHNFAHPDTLLSGVESRTSSPVRIHRDEELQANVAGIYPCGEGAGYAGGITSAAMDGIKVAEMIRKKYKN